MLSKIVIQEGLSQSGARGSANWWTASRWTTRVVPIVSVDSQPYCQKMHFPSQANSGLTRNVKSSFVEKYPYCRAACRQARALISCQRRYRNVSFPTPITFGQNLPVYAASTAKSVLIHAGHLARSSAAPGCASSKKRRSGCIPPGQKNILSRCSLCFPPIPSDPLILVNRDLPP